MGCCHSGKDSELETPAKGRPRERSQAKHKDTEGSLSGDIQERVPITDLQDDPDVENEEKQYVLDDVLDKIVADGWKYFIVDASNNYLSLPAEDDIEEDEGDWTTAFSTKLVPPTGLPEPGPQLFGNVAALPAADGLALLAAHPVAPCRSQQLIEISSHLIGSLSTFALHPVLNDEGQEIGVVADVDMASLTAGVNETDRD